MRIAINLVSISKVDSQAVYAYNIIKNLSKIVNSGEIIVFISKKNASILDGITGLEVKRFNLADWWGVRLLFTNFVLPIIFWVKKIDLIYTPNIIFPVFLGSRNIVTIHDLSYLKYKKYEPFFSGIFIRLMYRATAISGVIIAISNSVRSDILECLKIDSRKIKVVLNGLPEDHNVFKNENTAEDINLNYKYIVYVGMFRKRKNLDNLLLALLKIDNIKLVIVGSAIAGKKYFENKFSKKFINERVIFTGVIPGSLKNKLIKKSSALVFPSLYEGFGFPLLEAQSLNVPVIASNIRIFREVGEDSILYFNHLDPNDISNKIKNILEDDNLRYILIKKGVENLSRFDWANSSLKLYQIFIEKYNEKSISR